MKKKILFVSHDASRTGAPIVLKHFMQWLKEHADIEFSILIKEGGDIHLEDDFNVLGPVYKWSYGLPKKTLAGRTSSRLNNRLFKKPLYRKYPPQLKKKHFDLIYLNTVASTELLPYLKEHHNSPVILHVHEDAFSISAYYPDSLKSSYLSLIDHYITVSKNTQQGLIKKFHVPAGKISQVYAFVPVVHNPMPTKMVKAVKKELNLSAEFIVGASGVTSWRKGVDIFIQVALHIKKSLGSGKIKFIWVGHIEHVFRQQAEYELERLGLTDDDILFTDSVEQPQNYFQVFDIFVLTSREDPFPLVCLEAAALAKPVICFADSGGIPELLANGGGIVVPYADVQAMADAIMMLYNDNEKLEKLAREAKQCVQQFDVSVQAPLILNIIKKLI